MDSDVKPPAAGTPPLPVASRPGGFINDVAPPDAGGQPVASTGGTALAPGGAVPGTARGPQIFSDGGPYAPVSPAAAPSAPVPASTANAAPAPAESKSFASSIHFHVPGIHPDNNRASAKPAEAVTFDRDAPPPIAPRSANPTGKGHQALRDVISIGGVLISALLLAFCLITFVFQSYQVDGPSMQTTLQNSDHLIVWKVPKTFADLTRHAYIPNRGDVIVFNEPNLADFGQDSGKQLIKRVIALPGERVVVKNSIITVYNKEHPEGFQPDKDLPYGKVITTTPGNVDLTVGAKQIYVCGDNRTNSLDSRVFGPVDASNIVGKLVLRVLPLNSFKKF